MIIKKKILILIIFALSFIVANAERPDWSVNAVDYNYSMSYVGVVYLELKLEADDNSMIAAFTGQEVRGVCTPIYNEETKKHTFFLLVYSNEDNQDLTFKYYNSQTDKVTELDNTDTFTADAIKGSPFDPTIWAKPALIDAEMLSFKIENQIRSEIVANSINIVVEAEADMSSAIVDFEVSTAAVVRINDDIQVSGITKNDFTNQVIYTVYSADKLTENNYTVNIITNNLATINASKIVSPNGDGKNDVWWVENVEKFQESTFYIMDSYGHKVYESHGYDNTWNATYQGTELPTGTYYYIIEIPYQKPLAGTISIVR